MSKIISGRELLKIYYEITPNSDGSDRVERVLSEVSGGWQLKQVALADIDFNVSSVSSSKSQKNIKKIKKLKTEMPPVILDQPLGTYEIVDGFHRIAVALERGDQTILAYVPEGC